MFSGGTYDEVGRWLRDFVTAHAKRENPRAEVEIKDRAGKSDAVGVRLGSRVSEVIEFAYPEVAKSRGSLQ